MRRSDDLGPDEPQRNASDDRSLQPPRSGITPKHVVIGILAILLIAFAIANFEKVQVSFLLFDTEARVVTVIAIAGGLGFLIGYFVGRPNRQQRKRLAKLEDD